jgi:myo-inositol-1(or 4)-monophosphatase
VNPIVNVGIKAARQAGNIILRYIDQIDRLAVEKKGRNDFVSEVDRMAEEEIIETVHKLYPSHRILAEESGTKQSPEQADPDEYEWIIDPLDGTTNFLHGHPDFAVSIGVRKNGVIEHGVIYDPLRNEMFSATRNQGAQLNDRRMRVSGKNALRQCIITTGFPSREMPDYETWLKTSNEMTLKAAGIRSSGSAALDLAYVAAGRVDAFWQPKLKIWDLAAGSLLVREARGIVSDFDGEQNFLDSGNIIAGNSHVFTDVLSLIKTNTKGKF